MANPGNVRALTARFEAMFVVRENPLFETAKPPEQVLPKTDSMSGAGDVAVPVSTPEGSDSDYSDEDAGDDEVMQKMQDLEMEKVEWSAEKTALETCIKTMEIELETLRTYAGDERLAEMQTKIARLEEALKAVRKYKYSSTAYYNKSIALKKSVVELQTEIDVLKSEVDMLRTNPTPTFVADIWGEDKWEAFGVFIENFPIDDTMSSEEHTNNAMIAFEASLR